MSAQALTPARRAAQMRQKRKHGWTYQRIAEHYGVSRQRVHKIVNNQQEPS